MLKRNSLQWLGLILVSLIFFNACVPIQREPASDAAADAAAENTMVAEAGDDEEPPERGAVAEESVGAVSALPGCVPLPTVSIAEADLFNRVNQYRVDNGLNCLQMSDKLNQAANIQATFLAGGGAFNEDHYGKDGSGNTTHICDRQFDVGYYGAVAQENASMGTGDPASILDGWKHSSGHNATILDQKGYKDHFQYTGVSIVDNFAVQTFNHQAENAMSKYAMASLCLLSTPIRSRYHMAEYCDPQQSPAQPPAEDKFSICQEVAWRYSGDDWYRGRIIEYDAETANYLLDLVGTEPSNRYWDLKSALKPLDEVPSLKDPSDQ